MFCTRRYFTEFILAFLLQHLEVFSVRVSSVPISSSFILAHFLQLCTISKSILSGHALGIVNFCI